MAADLIQANYERLAELATRFQQQADLVLEMTQQVNRGMAALQEGGWQGEGIQAFSEEMGVEVLPAVGRLEQALFEAQRVTLHVAEAIRTAEEEAARLFDGQGNVAGETDSGGIQGSNAVHTTNGAGTPAPSVEQVLTNGKENIGKVFNEQYMEGMIGRVETGANTPRLNQAMEDLLDNVRRGNRDLGSVGQTLGEIAQLRGVDPATLREQYQNVFLPLWDNAVHKGDIDLKRQPDRLGLTEYMGSTVSLRYGRATGDIFGMDASLGSVLNPTGGMVGPASNAYRPHPNDAIGYHGVFHDLGGYLLNEQGIGPGYDYLNRDPWIFPNNSPQITGQVSGIAWWTSKHSELGVQTDIGRALLDNPIRVLPNFIEAPILSGVGFLEDHGVTYLRPKMGSINSAIGDVLLMENDVKKVWDTFF